VSHDFTFAIEYDYSDSDQGITLPVTLRFGEERVELPAKVDTGAQFSIFRREYGEMLGIDIEAGLRVEIGTVTGSFITYGHELSLSLLGYEFDAVVYFAEQHNFPRDVLGRHGLIERFLLCIVDYEGKLYLSEYNVREN
jgi:hypothetical protein